MSWLLTIFILSFTFNNLSEGRNERKLPSAVLVGTVFCDTCFEEEFTSASHFISDALLLVECGGTDTRPSFQKEVKTNDHGEFKVHLPISVTKHVKKIQGCSVKLINSSEPNCAVASTATSSSLHLKSRKEGTRIFSAGFFSFKPLKQPDLCNQKPSIHNPKKINAGEPLFPNPNDPSSFPPSIQDPPMPPTVDYPLPNIPGVLPKIPPLPPLPSLPPLPGIPFPPVPGKKSADSSSKTSQKSSNDQKVAVERSKFGPWPLSSSPKSFGIPFPPNPFWPPSILPPNPFQPPSILPPNPFQPPSILPPNPFQPPSILPPNPFSPPPSILPPNPFQQPPSIIPPILPSPPPSIFPPIFPTPPIFHFPPIPGLTPPSPPPPAFFFPLPPFPFQPAPGFPGNPPPSFSSPSKKTSP